MPLVSKTFSEIITFTRASTGTYFNAAGTLTSAAINEPRLDYNPSTLAAQGLLIEEARTNLLLYSEQFDNASGWTSTRASVTANATTAPTDTSVADKIVEDSTASNTHLTFSANVSVSTATIYTYTVYAKAAGRTWFNLQIGTGTEAYGATVPFSYFNLAGAGAIGTGANTTASIVSVGNGWYRCVLVAIATTAATTTNVRLKLANADANDSYTGDGTSGIFVYGAQIEAGAFPTSYIPTTTIALTRAADVAAVNTLSPWYNASEGTLYAEAVYLGQLIGAAAQTNSIQFSDGTAANRLSVRSVSDPTNPQLDANVATGGVLQMDTAGFQPGVVGTTYKRALAYAVNNAQHCVNGTLDGATDTSFAVPTGINVFTFPTSSCALYARRITYYPRRLSDAELQSITT